MDERFEFAHTCASIGPLSEALAELLAHLECARSLLAGTDWSQASVHHTLSNWPARSADRGGANTLRIGHWHGEEAAEMRRTIARAKGAAPLNANLCRGALTWRIRYLRKAFLRMAADEGFGTAASAIVDHARLTIGTTGNRASRWYAFSAQWLSNPAPSEAG